MSAIWALKISNDATSDKLTFIKIASKKMAYFYTKIFEFQLIRL